MNIKEIVKNNTAYFHYYRHKVIYFKVKVDEQWYSFPIDINDLGDATLNDREKAIRLMRYIRKALGDNTFQYIGDANMN